MFFFSFGHKSETCFELKKEISIQKLLFDYENWCFTSRNSYLNLKIGISNRRIIIWILIFFGLKKFIFEFWKMIFEFQQNLFEFQKWELISEILYLNLKLIFKSWKFLVEYEIWYLNSKNC